MAHDIQYIFDNITAKGPRSLDLVLSEINDLEYLMSIDRRKIALANMDKKKRKLMVELDRAKQKIAQKIQQDIDNL